MCTYLLQKGALWDAGLVHYGICELGQLQVTYGEALVIENKKDTARSKVHLKATHK